MDEAFEENDCDPGAVTTADGALAGVYRKTKILFPSLNQSAEMYILVANDHDAACELQEDI